MAVTNEDKTMAPEEKTEGAAALEEDDAEDVRWKPGDRVYAMWAGNSCYYPATVAEVQQASSTLVVAWDDGEDSHRVVSFDQVSEDTRSWSRARIDRRVAVRQTKEKGRCLFTKELCEPGQVVFVEKPVLVVLPALSPQLWEHLQKLHEAQPLNLGTVTFYFAALLSHLQLDPASVDIILDKFVPEPDEDPGEDVIRIVQSLQENLCADLKLNERPIDPGRLQRLVSAWRYNSFGHHKENGLVLYNRISMCAHSCDPSCCWSYGDDDAFVLRSRVALGPGDELTISYLQDEDLLKSTVVRQQKLQNWRFTCQCTRCCIPVDAGRGFRCRRCRIGILYASMTGGLEPCRGCNASPSSEDMQFLLRLEEEYVLRVENLDKSDIADVEAVYHHAIEIFEHHWILYIMDTMLWEAYREKKLADAIEHQRRRIEFHEHYYFRPSFILAWCHEELGDSLQERFPHRKWQYVQEFQRAYQMLVILCATNHQYTASPYNKLWQATTGGAGSAIAAG